MIYIYNGLGTSRESVEHTTLAFKSVSADSIATIDEETLLNGDWVKNAKLLIIPGGADVPYVRKLNGKGNQIIKKFIEDGGSYLGLCAGAYYGSSYVEFDKAGPLEVLGERELGFFPGKTIGPVLAPYDYHSKKGARAAKIQVHQRSGITNKLFVFCSGGPFFENAEQHANVEIIASYQIDRKQLPAIIKMKCKNGTVILSGVHFEYAPELLDAKDPYLKEIIPAMMETNEDRRALIGLIAEELNISIL